MSAGASASDRAWQMGLGSADPEERGRAEETLRGMGSEALPLLMQVIDEQKHTAHQQVQRSCARSLIRLGAAALLSLTLVILLSIPWWVGLTLVPLGLLVYSVKTLQQSFPPSDGCLQEHARALVYRIAAPQDVCDRLILLEYITKEDYDPLREELTPLLGQMQDAEAQRLTARHRQVLRLLLEEEAFGKPGGMEEPSFLVALLKALEVAGDASFVKPVRDMARTDFIGPERPVIEAARRCLPHLEAFAQRDRASRRLVRASASPPEEQTGALLVRPAASTPAPEPTLLVRTVEETE